MRAIAVLSFVLVLIVGKVEFSIEDDLSEQCKTSIEMIYTDKGILVEVLYRYIYIVAF